MVRKLIRLIKITELESWRTLRKISTALNHTLNTIQMSKMTKVEIEDLLFTLTSFRFEPVFYADDKLKYLYFNSRPFLE